MIQPYYLSKLMNSCVASTRPFPLLWNVASFPGPFDILKKRAWYLLFLLCLHFRNSGLDSPETETRPLILCLLNYTLEELHACLHNCTLTIILLQLWQRVIRMSVALDPFLEHLSNKCAHNTSNYFF